MSERRAWYEQPRGKSKQLASGAFGMPQPLAQRRTSLIVLGLAALLAVLGWGMYLSVKTGYDAQQARFNQERTELTERIADLESTLATERSATSERIGSLEGSLARERSAAGDLAALEARIGHAKADLNQRLAALGERERDRAAGMLVSRGRAWYERFGDEIKQPSRLGHSRCRNLSRSHAHR